MSSVNADTEEEQPQAKTASRFVYTGEVILSKIFPAGFGWQTASCISEGMGHQATDLSFFFMTGAGDFAGVLAGHSLYYLAKSAVDPTVKMGEQVQVGTWLASAAFMSGFCWQPIVNTLHDSAGMGFETTLAGTGVGCGLAFYAGLRLFRSVYSFFPALPAADSSNNVADAQLSAAIGGATACFVGTDLSFGASNWLAGIVGIGDVSTLTGAAIAGTSTALGFAIIQTFENLTIPAKKCWTDV